MNSAEFNAYVEKYFACKLYEQKTDLCDIMIKWGSDKGKYPAAGTACGHNYTTLYHYLFKHMRNLPVCVFECGLGTNDPHIISSMKGKGNPGGSIRAWKEYFAFGSIYGADIDEKIIFSEDRIKTYHLDQCNKEAVENMINGAIHEVVFDIIIDDGFHDLNCNIPFMCSMIKQLKEGGLYIIEDINNAYSTMAHNFVKDHGQEYMYCKYLEIPLPCNGGDNNVILIKK